MINLDTHIILHAATGSLRKKERELLDADEAWCISGIVLWEIAKLAEKGRIDFDLLHPDIVRALGAVYVFPINSEIAELSTKLDFDADPADEIIAATSVHHRVPLLTRDQVMRKSRLVPLA